jgi:hypothetical protein
MTRERKHDKKNYMILYSGHKCDKHESGIGVYISTHIMDNLLYFEPINYRMCKGGIKRKHYNLTLISTHAPTEEKDEVAKEEIYISLERYVMQFPITTGKQYWQTSTLKLEKSPIYIQPSQRYK